MIVATALVYLLATPVMAQGVTERPIRPPDTVVVRNGAVRLRALLWRPDGPGPFPAVLFNHGSGPRELTLTAERTAIGPVFARHGYALLFLHRRGSGLSADAGENSDDVMSQAIVSGGQPARSRAQLQLLERDAGDAAAALAVLRTLPRIDPRRVALVGHSFGGSLAIMLAARDTAVRASVLFGTAANSWNGSPDLQRRLRAEIARTRSPVFFIHAANDYSTAPGQWLSAELKRLGKSHRLEIYPSFGTTVAQGHDLIFLGKSVWESAVIAFLDQHVRR